jgi:hypothetical protein
MMGPPVAANEHDNDVENAPVEELDEDVESLVEEVDEDVEPIVDEDVEPIVDEDVEPVVDEEPPGRILSLVPAEPGWRAVYGGDFADERELARVVAWALVEARDGERRIVGMVIDPTDPTRVVPAPDAASATAGFFERYGFKER